MRVDPTSGAAALETLRRMVEIPSPSGSEGAVAAFLAERMTALGYTTRIDGAGNVVGEIGQDGGPTVMLVGHMDTVPGQLPVREVDGVLFGRGTVDAKGPLAAMAHAGARAARSPGAGRLVVVGAVDEEGRSRGAQHLLATAERPDLLVIGEPSGAGAVVVGYKGILRFDYSVRRPAAHTSSPGERAVEIAADLWSALRDRLAADQDGTAPAFDRAIPALVGLDGDITAARAQISCRVPHGFDADGVLDWARQWRPGGETTVLEHLPAVRTSRADPAVRAFAAAVRRVTGDVTLRVKLGTSDMNVLAPSWDVPAIAYGPGDSALDHTDAEHVSLSEYLRAIDALTVALPAATASLGTTAAVPRTAAPPLPAATVAARVPALGDRA